MKGNWLEEVEVKKTMGATQRVEAKRDLDMHGQGNMTGM